MLASTPFDDTKPLEPFCVGKSKLVTTECEKFDITWEWSTVRSKATIISDMACSSTALQWLTKVLFGVNKLSFVFVCDGLS